MAAMTSVFSSKGDVAYAELRHRILSGSLAPGSKLDQYELADDMSMSITPVREAIRRLSTEGLIELGSHRTARIAGVGAAEARELHEVRLLLDPGAAELAAQRRTEGDLADLREAASRLVPVTREQGEEALVATAPSTGRSTSPRTTTCSSPPSMTSGTSRTAIGASGCSCRPAPRPASRTTRSTCSCSGSSRPATARVPGRSCRPTSSAASPPTSSPRSMRRAPDVAEHALRASDGTGCRSRRPARARCAACTGSATARRAPRAAPRPPTGSPVPDRPRRGRGRAGSP